MRERFLNHPWVAPVWAYIERHRRHVPAASLAVGFVWDLVTIGRPDQIFGNAVILTYLAIAAGSIVLLNMRRREGESVSILLLGIMQFSFGAVTSGLLILYGRSGTFEGSALFFLILGALFIGNEFLRSRYERIHFHLAVWYLLLLSYLVLIIPVVMKEIGDRSFQVSIITSIALAGILIGILYFAAARSIANRLRSVVISISLVLFGFIGLYVSNVLPPVPLALTSIGIYHSLEREVGGAYAATYEKPHWWEVWRDTSPTFHRRAGDTAYCFSSVFAPAGLTAPIYHHWEYYRDGEGWSSVSRISFPIVGGRDTGYRGYSLVSNPRPGVWRCNVETAGGALVGRSTVEVLEVSESPELSATRL